MPTHNSREGVEEIHKAIQDEVAGEMWYESRRSEEKLQHLLVNLEKRLIRDHNQELQKALEIQAIEIREEEANEYNKIIEQELQKERERCITKAWSYIVDATHAESWSRDELRKAVQSELDQPNK